MRTMRRVQEPIVALIHNEDIHTAVNSALDLLPIERLLRPNDTVMVKFNAVSVQSGGFASSPVTKPETLSAVIKWFQVQPLKRLIFAEGSKGGDTTHVMEETGLMKVIRETGVEFLDLNTGPYIELPLAYDKPPIISINAIFEEIDVLVSLAALKMHEEATVTLTQKNIALGIPSGEMHGFPLGSGGKRPFLPEQHPHSDLHSYIVQVMHKMPIDIAIIDGKTTMIGTGPIKGNPVPTNVIVAGTDALATDVIGARLLGFKPQGVRYLYQGIHEGLGEGDMHKIELRGAPFREVAAFLSKQTFGKEIIIE